MARHPLPSLAAFAIILCVGAQTMAQQDAGAVRQEFYELRVYKVQTAEKQQMVDTYLEKALLPALNRMGIDRVGVFKVMDKPKDLSVFMLIPYPTLEVLSQMSATLAGDQAYQDASRDYFSTPKKDPVFGRMESRFYKAFAGMPVIEMPAQTAAKEDRLFELRLYESHNEDKAVKKVEMFNVGEMQVMRDTGLAPVFFGEALIAPDLPHMLYMLSAANPEEHQAHWKAFGGHPEWKRLRSLPRYADTVSRITKWMLAPTAYSQI